MKSNFDLMWTGILFTLFAVYFSMTGCGTRMIIDDSAAVQDTTAVVFAGDTLSTASDTTAVFTEDTVYTYPDTICIAAVGDVMMGTEGRLPSDCGVGSSASCADLLGNADIAFLNLEGPLTNRGGTYKEC